MTQVSVNNDALLEKARQLCLQGKSNEEIVEMALEEYVQRRETPPFESLFGTVEFDEGWDPVQVRKREREAAGKQWEQEA